MSQSPKEQADIAMWNELSKELKRLGVAQGDREIAEITEEIAKISGYSPEQVMAGLLEGMRQGDLTITDETVRFNTRTNP